MLLLSMNCEEISTKEISSHSNCHEYIKKKLWLQKYPISFGGFQRDHEAPSGCGAGAEQRYLHKTKVI